MTPAPPAPVPKREPETTTPTESEDRSLLNATSLGTASPRETSPALSETSPSTTSLNQRSVTTSAEISPAVSSGSKAHHYELHSEGVRSPENAQSSLGSQPPQGEPSSQGSQLSQTAQSSKTTSDADMIRSTGSMAVATLLSRITGFIRTAMIGAALGPAVGSAFTTANTLPNLITEIVLGAVLTSLVVPVLVRAEKEDPDRGEAFIRRLFTLSATLLLVVTVVAVLGGEFLTHLLLRENGETNVVQATSFAYLLLPQIFFYGVFSLFMAILNTKEIFKPGAWAPVANNVVSIAVLAIYMILPGSLDPDAPSGVLDRHVLLLGVGTTLGVVTQALIMLPYLRKAGINLRPLWGIDDRLKQFGGMATAIVAYVAISQFGYTIATRIASGSWKPAIIIYSNHWLLLQVPYGLIGVALLTAIMPRLSKNAADGNDAAVIRDLTIAAKLTLVAIVPVVFFMSFFGGDISTALFVFGNFGGEEAEVLGQTVQFSAFTLIPYALVLLHLRVFYAREEAWTPTWIIAGITATKVLLSYIAPLIATRPEVVVVLLAGANGFGFLSGAVVGTVLLRRRLGEVGGGPVFRTFLWSSFASLAGVLITGGLRFLLLHYAGDFLDSTGKVGEFALVGILALVFLTVTGMVLSRSGLPEVATLGTVLARIPGLNRIITAPATSEETAHTAGVDKEEPSTEILAQAAATPVQTDIAGLDSWQMSPVPPPMSGGLVRPPRQVAGAPLANGRFRLLAQHGATESATFWQAQEQATGKMVSITFVDTVKDTDDPFAISSAESRERTHALKVRTELLASIKHPGIARGIEVLPYRLGAIIIADWVKGSSLETATAQGVNTRAVALALSPLVDATATLHDNSAALGLVDPAQIRISTHGIATLAFPMVTAEATALEDRHGLQKVVDYIADAEADRVGREKLDGHRDHQTAQTDRANQENLRNLLRDSEDLHETARRLQKAGLGETLHIRQEPTPTDVPSRGGFGGKNSNRATAAIFAAASILVVILAIAIAYIVGTIGSKEHSPNVPINPSVILPPNTSPIPDPLTPTEQPIAQTLDGTVLVEADTAVDGTTANTWKGSSLELGFENTLSVSSLELHTTDSYGIYLQILSNTPNLIEPEGATLTAENSQRAATSGSTLALTPPGTVIWEGYITDDSMTIELDEPAVLNGMWLSFGAQATVADTSVSGITVANLIAEDTSDNEVESELSTTASASIAPASVPLFTTAPPTA